MCKYAGMENALEAYLQQTGMTQAALADAVGISRGHMSLIVKRLRSPSLGIAVKIERATGGAVPASSLVQVGAA